MAGTTERDADPDHLRRCASRRLQHSGRRVPYGAHGGGGSGDVGRRVLDAIAKGEFFIFTHEEPRDWIEKRHRRLMDGFDSVERYNKRESGT